MKAKDKKKKVFVGVSGGVDPSTRAKLSTGQVALAFSCKKKVFVGVSGGVDSSVALALLQKDGYDVTGVFLKTWHPEFLPCDWKEERRSAMRVCATLCVSFLTIDCEKEYKKEVADYMIHEYSLGRVPNPDVFCNKYVKFGVFLKKALEMGADFIATGHYARIEERSTKHEARIFSLLEGKDKNKDQSYFLYTLNQEQLAHTIFPVGNMTKPEVRKLAEKFGLPTATKKDSQGVCFLGKLDMKEFLTHYIKPKKGNVLNQKGEIVGSHDGAFFYTIGQRHGFSITKKTSNEPRYFVIQKDIKNNTITVANKINEEKAVYSLQGFEMTDICLIEPNSHSFPCKTYVRIRYRQEKQKCLLEKTTTGFKVKFDKSQNAIAEGQSAVFYDGNTCLGGGIIDQVVNFRI